MGCAAFRVGGTGGWNKDSNPCNKWRYGYKNSKTSSFVLFTTKFDFGPNKGWQHPDNIDYGNIWKNYAEYTLYGVLPGQISLQPGQLGQWTVVRWTAPSAGTFNVSGYFGAGSMGRMTYSILHNNVSELFFRDYVYSTESFNLEVTVSAGDTLDFQVGVGWDFGNTPIDITVGNDYFNMNADAGARIRNLQRKADSGFVRSRRNFYKDASGAWRRINI